MVCEISSLDTLRGNNPCLIFSSCFANNPEMFCALTAKSCSIFLFFVLIFSLREQFKKGKLKELQICSNVHPQYIFPG